MASIELREAVVAGDPDQPPPIYRQSGSLRVQGGSTRSGAFYKSVAFDEPESSSFAAQLSPLSCAELTLRFVLANKINFLVLANVILLLSGLSTLSIVAALAHGGGFASANIICGGGDNETCTVTTNVLPPAFLHDPDDLDAVALHELTRRELFTVIKRAVRETFISPGNQTSILQILARDLTAHLETLQHPESGK